MFTTDTGRVVHAGDHGIPLDELHAQMLPETLRRHLGLEHNYFMSSDRGNAAAQRVHKRIHERSERNRDQDGN
jgi:hypothetical protein